GPSSPATAPRRTPCAPPARRGRRRPRWRPRTRPLPRWSPDARASTCRRPTTRSTARRCRAAPPRPSARLDTAAQRGSREDLLHHVGVVVAGDNADGGAHQLLGFGVHEVLGL